MGIRFTCPNGHKLNVKTHLAGKRGVCPMCGARFEIPATSELVPPAATALATSGPSIELEIAAPPPTHAAGAMPSASVIIPVADAPHDPAQVPLERTGAAVTQAPAPLPDSVIAAVAPSSTANTLTDPQRDRRRRNQVLISIFLLFMVIALAVVLVVVLKRDRTPQAGEKTGVIHDSREPAQSIAAFPRSPLIIGTILS